MDRDIRDKVIEVHTMMGTVVKGVADIKKKQEGFDKRLRSVETFRSWMIGLMSTGAIGGSGMAVLGQLMGGG